jgi:acetyl esterase/lipase
MLDDRSAHRLDLPYSEWMTWSTDNNRLGWEAYLQQAPGTDNLRPYAVASRRKDLGGLPPAWIGVGTLDLFFEEDVAYAQALKNCGVDCDLVVIPGAFHGFDQFDPKLKVVQGFRNSQIDALRKHLFPK